jgi:hypothetical protein
VVEDVSRGVQLVAAGAGGEGLGADGPDTTRGGELSFLGVVRGFLLRDANPVARVVVGEAAEDVEVNVGDARNCDVEIPALERFYKQTDN